MSHSGVIDQDVPRLSIPGGGFGRFSDPGRGGEVCLDTLATRTFELFAQRAQSISVSSYQAKFRTFSRHGFGDSRTDPPRGARHKGSFTFE